MRVVDSAKAEQCSLFALWLAIVVDPLEAGPRMVSEEKRERQQF